MTYDLLRLPFMGWMLLCAALQLIGLAQLHTISMDFVFVIHIALRLSTIAFMLLAAGAVILRTRPSGKASGLEPRISALFGTFLMYAAVSYVCCCFFSAARPVSLRGNGRDDANHDRHSRRRCPRSRSLGRSFSIMAESRQLVTTGPYRFVRHPLYLAEEIAMVSISANFAIDGRQKNGGCQILVGSIRGTLRGAHRENPKMSDPNLDHH
jgi:hypothetical protein